MFLIISAAILMGLAIVWGVRNTISSPVRLIFVANFFYFFVLYALLTINQVERYESAKLIIIAFGISFLVSEAILSQIKISTSPFRVSSILCIVPHRSVVLVYFVVIGYLIFEAWNKIGVIDPFKALSTAYSLKSGVKPEPGSYVKILLMNSTIWLLFILSLQFSLTKNKLWLSTIVFSLFLYLQFFSGSKSALIMPFAILFFLRNRVGSEINLYKQVLIVSLAAVSIAFLLVHLNYVRSGIAYKGDFLSAFLFRIDFIPTLSGYIEKHQDFISVWPPFEFLMNFVPSKIAGAIGFERHTVSFDVLYTQFAYENEYRLSSSAGVGIAAVNETLRPLGLNIPLFAAIITGVVSSLATTIAHRLLAMEGKMGGVYLFAAIVPPFHVIAFFEPGPTAFFKILLSMFIVFVLIYPLLRTFGCIRHCKKI